MTEPASPALPALPACPSCLAPGCAELLQREGYRYYVCGHCDEAFLHPQPAPEVLDGLYGGNAYFEGGGHGGYSDYDADEALHRDNARRRLERVRARFAGAGRLVDVGCATGFFLDEARRAGLEVTGVEVSRWAASRARARLDAPVHSDLSEVQGQADVVTFFQVLEHMPDPSRALAKAHAILRPGGLLVIETWDRSSLVARAMGAHWQQVTPPSVLFLFSRRSLQQRLERAGFGGVAQHSSGKRVSAGFVSGLLAEKYPRALGQAARLLQGSAVGQLGVTYRLGDLVTVTATRS